MKALVTGGCGFIGSHLVKKLVDKGAEVTVVDDLSAGDLMNLHDKDIQFRAVHPGLLEQFYAKNTDIAGSVVVITSDFVEPAVLNHFIENDYTHVFHLAANPRVEYSVQYPAMSTETNLMKTIELLSACRQTNIEKFIFASSSAVYGQPEGNIESIEDFSKTAPSSPYGLQKLVCEMFMRQFSDLYNLDIVALRLFNVYGPGCYGDNPYATAIAAWCDKIKKNEPLRSDGDGSQTRDMVYVDDVAEAMARFAYDYKEKGFVVSNVGTNYSLSNNEILNHLKMKFSDIAIINAPERTGDVKHTLASVKRIKKCLNWSPDTSFSEGLLRTLAWWDLNERNF